MAGSVSLSESSSTSANSLRTRTLAIIKSDAIPNRFEIESRISSSGFEIIKERQLNFHHDDPGVYQLFGDEAESLCGEPVWIYVLERRRAIEVWKSLMGDQDPDLAKIASPDSLRALFGQNERDNAVYGSPDANMAELQINSIFASSPPFPPNQMDDNDNEDVPQISISQGSSGEENARVDIKSKTGGFKARAVPITTVIPSISPRTTKAAALRAGIEVSQQKRSPATRESIARTFENVPGHKRSITVNVASTAEPTIAPRQTRASALRTGQIEPTLPRAGPPRKSMARQSLSPGRKEEIFADVPGHKRRQSIPVASTAPPSIAPRQTKASQLRTGQIEPSKPRPRTSNASSSRSPTLEKKSSTTFEGVPGHKRSTTIEVASTRPPSTTPRLNKSSALRIAHKDTSSSVSRPPPSSFFMKSSYDSNSGVSLNRSASQASMRQENGMPTSSSGRSASVEPGAVRAESRTSTAAPPRPPSIVPRTNKSALLRAEKMANPNTPTRKVFAF